VTVTQAGLPDAEAHIAVDGSIHVPGCGGDASVVQADLLQRYALTQPLSQEFVHECLLLQ